jgi:hypothetical protein
MGRHCIQHSRRGRTFRVSHPTAQLWLFPMRPKGPKHNARKSGGVVNVWRRWWLLAGDFRTFLLRRYGLRKEQPPLTTLARVPDTVMNTLVFMTGLLSSPFRRALIVLLTGKSESENAIGTQNRRAVCRTQQHARVVAKNVQRCPEMSPCSRVSGSVCVRRSYESMLNSCRRDIVSVMR